MKRVKLADLKNQLSQYLRAAEQGIEIEVADRQRPIVRLVPARTLERRPRIVPSASARCAQKSTPVAARESSNLEPSA